MVGDGPKMQSATVQVPRHLLDLFQSSLRRAFLLLSLSSALCCHLSLHSLYFLIYALLLLDSERSQRRFNFLCFDFPTFSLDELSPTSALPCPPFSPSLKKGEYYFIIYIYISILNFVFLKRQ